MKPSIVFDLTLTGLLLGAAQVALFFHMLATTGAMVIVPFLLIVIWLIGSISGLRISESPRAGFAILLTGLLLLSITILTKEQLQFSALGTTLSCVSALCFGAFGGWFLKVWIKRTGEVSRVLLHENNGFIAGYTLAAALLFSSAKNLNALLVLLAVLALARSLTNLSTKQQSGS